MISLKGGALPHQGTTSNSANTASPGTAWGIALGFLSVWIAAGSVGVLAVPLREVLAVLVLLLAVACLWPRSQPAGRIALGLVVLAFVAFRVAIPAQVEVWPLVTVAAMNVLAVGKRDADRHRLALGGVSILAFVLYRLAQQSVPWVWQIGDALGGGLGSLIHGLTGRPLDVGASFGGVDFLILMSVFYLGWLVALPAPRVVPAVFAGIAIVAGHLVYLALVAFSPEITRMAPPVALLPFRNPYIPPEVDGSRILHQLLPWNLPVLAGVLHAVMAWSMVRWGRWQARVGTQAARERGEIAAGRRRIAALAGLVLLAALPVVFAVLRTTPSRLAGRTILAGPGEQLDWRVPLHDRYGRDSAGTFGMLPLLVESLGGNLQRSDAFSAAELESADAVLLLAPDEPLAADQRQRIAEYVQAGGAVLVAAEAFDPRGGWNDAIDDLLAPTNIRVARDAALSITGDWWNSVDVWPHAAMAAVSPRQMRFLSDAGASIRPGWSARPLLVGRWGWSGPERAARWDSAQPLRVQEKLGDLVLAAEQRVGQGTVVVLGDPISLTNEGLREGYSFSGSLLSYLANRAAGPQSPWRQWATVLCCVGLVVLSARSFDARRLVVVSLVLFVSWSVCARISLHAGRVVPDGRLISGPDSADFENRLAYIDASHLEPYSRQDWGFDALNGLALNLMRNGFLPLMLHGLTVERLDRAGMVVSIAPARGFSGRERWLVQQFVERGGLWVSMVGAEQARAGAPLLADLGLRVPHSPVATVEDPWEPDPFGRGRAEYLEVEDEQGEPYRVGVRFFAGWPVESLTDDAEVLAYGRNQLRVVTSDTELPVILTRTIGRGRVVLIGDTSFAMNKNLEYVGGEPFAGRYENAQFWRWLLARMTGRDKWIPPRPPPRDSSTENGDDDLEWSEGDQ